MARPGKIARLPKKLREELNRRLQDGEPFPRLADWLNGLVEVQEILQASFKGQAIRQQNITEWKKWGYEEWERAQKTQSMLGQFLEHTENFTEAANGAEMSDCMAAMLAMRMAELAPVLLDKETEPEKQWKRLCAVHRQVSRMRRDDHRRVRTMIRRDQWAQELEREEQKQKKSETSLTPEEMDAEYRRIFGLSADYDFRGIDGKKPEPSQIEPK